MSSPTSQAFTPIQSAVVISMGVIAGCVSALQPILLGSLEHENQINLTQIGQAATAEALGMAGAATLAAMFLKPDRLKPITLVALLIALLANAATAFASGLGVILLRGLSGLCSGTLLWLLLGLIARAQTPGRTFAIYVTLQATISFLFSLLLSKWLVVTTGAMGGYLLFSAADLLLILAVFAMPASYNSPETQAKHTFPPLKGLLGLVAVGLFIASIMAFWVYVLPLGAQLGYPAIDLGNAVSMAIGSQIAAGICAVIWAARLRPFTACLVGTLLIIGSIAIFQALPTVAVLYASLIVFAFVWMFVPPFQMPLLIELDPSLRSALFIGTAQLSGVALGPIFAAMLISDLDTSMAANTGILLALLSLMFLFAARFK